MATRLLSSIRVRSFQKDKDHPNAMSSGETDSKGRPLPDTSKIREDSYQELYSPLMSSLSKYL